MSLFRFVVRNLPLFLALAVLPVATSDASAGPLKRLRDRRTQSQTQCQPAASATPVQAPAPPTPPAPAATPVATSAPVASACASGNCSVGSSSTRRGLFFRR